MNKVRAFCESCGEIGFVRIIGQREKHKLCDRCYNDTYTCPCCLRFGQINDSRNSMVPCPRCKTWVHENCLDERDEGTIMCDACSDEYYNRACRFARVREDRRQIENISLNLHNISV